ncbi:hypothetical protein [uncultured Pseudomonas sp.]|uniref:hypothetical protein n=1 Tax=uncultured Pseudomonas sp. TaxID=114707 RepID=UPI00261159F7|nr:hypothetical protein [uncultured Pseudomonas sp.]
MNRLSADQLPQETQGFIDEYVRELKNNHANLADKKIKELIRKVSKKFKPKPTDEQIDNYLISRGLFS